MKQIPEVYPVVTVTVVFFGPRPKSRKPTSTLVKVELHGEEIHDLGKSIEHMERALDTLRGTIKMYRKWEARR